MNRVGPGKRVSSRFRFESTTMDPVEGVLDVLAEKSVALEASERATAALEAKILCVSTNGDEQR